MIAVTLTKTIHLGKPSIILQLNQANCSYTRQGHKSEHTMVDQTARENWGPTTTLPIKRMKESPILVASICQQIESGSE